MKFQQHNPAPADREWHGQRRWLEAKGGGWRNQGWVLIGEWWSRGMEEARAGPGASGGAGLRWKEADSVRAQRRPVLVLGTQRRR
jgi:hypothetical protein